MKKEVLLVIKDNPRLVEINEELEKRGKAMGEKMFFLRKQMETVAEETKKSCLPLWSEVEKMVGESGKLPPDYSREKYHFSFDDGAVLIKENRGINDVSKFLQAILGV